MICITLWGKAAGDDGGENDFVTVDLGLLANAVFENHQCYGFSDKLDGFLKLG